MIPTASPPVGPLPPPSAVDRISKDLGLAFVSAIVAGDFDRLESLLAPGVRFRAITPSAFREASTAADARAFIEGWFGETDERELRGSRVAHVGDRLMLGYRLALTEAGERLIVEQHIAAAVDGRQFRDLALLCSGFRPLASDRDGAIGMLGEDLPSGDKDEPLSPTFAPVAHLDATGLSCATLTPTIRSAVLALDFGAVLEIVTDDPEAEEGLRSWTRLTGNELVAVESGRGSARSFGIRRSPRRAATTTGKGTN